MAQEFGVQFLVLGYQVSWVEILLLGAAVVAMAEQVKVARPGINNTTEVLLMGAIAIVQLLLFALGAAKVDALRMFDNTEFLLLTLINVAQTAVAYQINARTVVRLGFGIAMLALIGGKQRLRLVAQLLQVGQNLALPGGIERGERLVEEEEPGAHQERAAERDALALPTRELPRPPIEQVPDVEQIQDARRFGAIARKPAHAAAVVEIRRNAQMREQAAS